MMRSLYSGVSGLKTHQTKMDVIGNNIANVNTVAFKSSSTVFSELMYQTTSQASGPSALTGRGGVNAKQIGLGVTTGSTTVNITAPGSSQTTGEAFDLKITGDSFFVVSDGTANYFTKAGSFYIDGAGNLSMKSTGYNVQGWQVDPTTGEIRKDTVSALRIMQEKNLTSPPEATELATCAGILDKFSTNVNDDAGQVMNLTFFDSLGYEFTAKFKINSNATSQDTGTYAVELTDILDADSKSVLDKYLGANAANNKGNIFGVQNLVQKNYPINTGGGFGYTGGNFTYTPEGGTAVRLQPSATPGVYESVELVNGQTFTASLTTIFSGMSQDAADNFQAANIDTTTTPPSYKYSYNAYNYELDFNESNGAFGYINNAGNSTVRLNASLLGPNFKDVTIDFSQTKWVENSKQSTIGMEKGGGKDGTEGAGKRLGDLIDLSVSNDGTIWGSYDNGNSVLLGQIAVAIFANPSGLEKVGDNCYQTTLNSGDFDGIGQDILADGGTMTSGVLEMSNVDLSAEFTEMITTQRGFQANSRIITTSDTLLEELINLKR